MKTLYKVATSDYSAGEYLVFANSYDEAARKVENHYIEKKIDEKENEQFFDEDGSLNFLQPKRKEEFAIRRVEIVEATIIM